MWVVVINGLTYVAYGFRSGRFRLMLLPVSIFEVVAEVRKALRLDLAMTT